MMSFPNDVVFESLHANGVPGLTETCTVVCSSPETDIWFGSSGSLVPGYKAKIVSIEGVEITGYDQPGELVVQSPSVVLGYLDNDKANTETFLDDTDGGGRWMRTGDEAVVRKAPSGNEHIFIVDRIKELIKVKVDPIASNAKITITNNRKRECKLRPPNSRHTSLRTLQWQTAP